LETMRSYWSKGIPEKLTYRQGEKTLYSYLEENARIIGNETAYIFYGNRLTWKRLLEEINQFSCYLKNKGVRKGSFIALYLQNCPQYIIAHYSIQQLGGIVVPLNPMYKESELAYFLKEVPIKGVICSEDGLQRIRKAEKQTTALSFIVSTSYSDYLPPEKPAPAIDEFRFPSVEKNASDDWLTILKTHDPYREKAEIDLWNDPSLIVFTSGTTGRPKGAMLTYGNALFKTAASVQANGMGENERMMAHAPLCHIAGMVMGLNIPVYTGNPCVLFTRFDPVLTVDVIEEERITLWYSVAPMNGAILQLPDLDKRDLSSLKHNLATSFGMQVTEELARQWEKVTGGCIMHEAAYGLSETHTCDTFMPKDKIKFGSCGIPVYDTEMKIVDPETGQEKPQGESGEIIIKSPGVFKGYYNRKDATAETLRDGWVYTGDIGYFDEDGYLYFQGRLKEMIKSSGYSIFPEDVEALLNEHPAVLQSAVIGVPDPVKGEQVKAFVVLREKNKESVTSEELIRWAKENMAAYKYPRQIEILEYLPATPSGKILRKLLKEK